MHSTAHTTEHTRKLRARKTGKTFFLSLLLCHVLSRRMGSYSILFDMEKQHGKCSHAELPLFILISYSYTSTRLSPKNSLIPSELLSHAPHRVWSSTQTEKAFNKFCSSIKLHVHFHTAPTRTTRYVSVLCTYTFRRE